MLVVNSVLSADEYKDLRWEVIKRLEGVKEFSHMAGEGAAVIGVGFNIENNSDLLEKVFIKIFTLDRCNGTVSQCVTQNKTLTNLQ